MSDDISRPGRTHRLSDFSPHVVDLVLLDGLAHHYGRTVPRNHDAHEVGGMPRDIHRFYEDRDTPSRAYFDLSRTVHIRLVERLREPEFFSETRDLIRWWATLNRRRKGGYNPGQQPPTQGVAFAYFLQQHQTHEAVACYPWWVGSPKPLRDDEPPDLPPYIPPRPG